MKLPLKVVECAGRVFGRAKLIAGRIVRARKRRVTAMVSAVMLTSSIAIADPVGAVLVGHDTVNAGESVSYDVTLRAGEATEVDLFGDGLADFDLDLYDENYNSVARDHSLSTDASVLVIPAWTGTFHLVVTNRGRLRSYFRFSVF